MTVYSILNLNRDDIATLTDGMRELVERLRLEQPDSANALDVDYRRWLDAMHTAVTLYDRLTTELGDMTDV